MRGRIDWDGKVSGYATDWRELVDKPANNGYFVEAFSSADAIIDSCLQSMLRQIFNTAEGQNLINQLDSVKAETQFFGTGILKILENIKVIDKNLGKKIRVFKSKRNLVCHTIKAEYTLVRLLDYKDQKELDDAVEKEAKHQLSKALSIFIDLEKISSSLYTTFQGMNHNQKLIWYHKKRNEISK